MSTAWPPLHPSIEVDESAGDVGEQYQLFELFEALHHRQRICNPMNEAELDRLVDLLTPTSVGSQPPAEPASPVVSMVDFGCGSGELLLRLHEAGIGRDWVGCDLSPWMLNAAAGHGDDRAHGAGRWVLGHGAKWSAPAGERVSCIGAEWIFHGMRGTVAALAATCVPGGRVAFGGPRLRFGADPDTVTATHGRLDTAADVEDALAAHGLSLVERIDPGEPGWRSYLQRVGACAAEWLARYPGPKAEGFVEEHRAWAATYDQEAHIVGWSVWVADR